MTLIATTARLSLSEFCDADATGFFRLNQDPEVLKYTGDTAFANLDAARGFIRQYDQYQRYGLGRWALHFNGDFIGFCGLKQHLGGDVDLGFRLMRCHWGKGLAFEAACAAILLANDRYGLLRLVARAMEENDASSYLLTKLGFSRCQHLDAPPWQGFELELHTASIEANLAAWRDTVSLTPRQGPK
ncbi:GNAT family N-acetyltransferase [Shewanella sp.]|uniref:GNAT family N-acetyltransferase n=1 Tax=Shewanella sp. TaxID=50422 RepID=UPI003567099D